MRTNDLFPCELASAVDIDAAGRNVEFRIGNPGISTEHIIRGDSDEAYAMSAAGSGHIGGTHCINFPCEVGFRLAPVDGCHCSAMNHHIRLDYLASLIKNMCVGNIRVRTTCGNDFEFTKLAGNGACKHPFSTSQKHFHI